MARIRNGPPVSDQRDYALNDRLVSGFCSFRVFTQLRAHGGQSSSFMHRAEYRRSSTQQLLRVGIRKQWSES
jgi:hypothetical protein